MSLLFCFVLFIAVEIHAMDHISTQEMRIKGYTVILTNVAWSIGIFEEGGKKNQKFPKKI